MGSQIAGNIAQSFWGPQKKFTDSTDSTDRLGLNTSKNGVQVCKVSRWSLQTTDFVLIEFVRRWFAGLLGDTAYLALREIFYCRGNMRNCREKNRGPWSLEGLSTLFHSYIKSIYSCNILMGVGFWLSSQSLEVPREEDDLMLYDRVFYDFDSEEEPERAREVAIEFAESIRRSYGATPVVVDTGFKGAHIYVFLKSPIKYSAYRPLWSFLLRLSKDDSLADRNVVKYNWVARIPFTYNIKDGKRAKTRIIYPRAVDPASFRFEDIVPLDPAKVKIYVLKPIELPKEIKAEQVGARNTNSYRWVERVIESGLPDGRQRFILYVLSAYLVNIKNLGIEEAHQIVKKFIENSCKNFNNCSKVYDSFILGDLKRVKEKGLKPASMKTIQEKDPQLYSIIMEILNKSSPTSTNSITTNNIDIESEQLRVPPELQAFLRESGFREFSYGDVKNWIEKCFGSIEASKWHSIERSLRQLAEKCVLGRKFLVDGSWIDYGCGKIEKPPSKDVRFYVVKDLSLLSS
jgi:hypothetical protein